MHSTFKAQVASYARSARHSHHEAMRALRAGDVATYAANMRYACVCMRNARELREIAVKINAY